MVAPVLPPDLSDALKVPLACHARLCSKWKLVRLSMTRQEHKQRLHPACEHSPHKDGSTALFLD